VGITRYHRLDPNLQLQGSERDAVEFTRWLLRKDRGGGRLPQQNVRLVLSSASVAAFEQAHPDCVGVPHVPLVLSPGPANAGPLAPWPATRDLDDHFFWLLEKRDQDGRLGRRLYVFFAGHGFALQENSDGLLMADGDFLDYCVRHLAAQL